MANLPDLKIFFRECNAVDVRKEFPRDEEFQDDGSHRSLRNSPNCRRIQFVLTLLPEMRTDQRWPVLKNSKISSMQFDWPRVCYYPWWWMKMKIIFTLWIHRVEEDLTLWILQFLLFRGSSSSLGNDQEVRSERSTILRLLFHRIARRSFEADGPRSNTCLRRSKSSQSSPEDSRVSQSRNFSDGMRLQCYSECFVRWKSSVATRHGSGPADYPNNAEQLSQSTRPEELWSHSLDSQSYSTSETSVDQRVMSISRTHHDLLQSIGHGDVSETSGSAQSKTTICLSSPSWVSISKSISHWDTMSGSMLTTSMEVCSKPWLPPWRTRRLYSSVWMNNTSKATTVV